MHTVGLHHVTAIAKDAQRNIDFYTGILGLRLIKLTVNFDDPRAYHLYYGNELGDPGSILTFFVWPELTEGRYGTGAITAISFSIPQKAVMYWRDRLRARQIPFEESNLFGSSRIIVCDPDGLTLELVAEKILPPTSPWTLKDIDKTNAIRGFHGITLCEDGSEHTRDFLINTFGYEADGDEGSVYRYTTSSHEAGKRIYVQVLPDLPRGGMGTGAIHHAAFRAPTDRDELSMRAELQALGIGATPVIDRTYFHSVYFREPAGILFEIATDGPGFAVDEDPKELGASLKLPAKFEPYRGAIVRSLKAVTLPTYDR